jgi:hypothetical protein
VAVHKGHPVLILLAKFWGTGLVVGPLKVRRSCRPPEKSRGRWHAATRMFRVVAGVLRLLPTKRGAPAVMTAPTAAISPLRFAESASLCVPPSGAWIRTMSAALPALSEPQSRRYTLALLPVAAAMRGIFVSAAKAPNPALASQTPCLATSPRLFPVRPGSRMMEPACTVMPRPNRLEHRQKVQVDSLILWHLQRARRSQRHHPNASVALPKADASFAAISGVATSPSANSTDTLNLTVHHGLIPSDDTPPVRLLVTIADQRDESNCAPHRNVAEKAAQEFKAEAWHLVRGAAAMTHRKGAHVLSH